MTLPRPSFALASLLLLAMMLPVAAHAELAPSVRWASLLPFVGSALRGVEGEYGPTAEVRASMRQAPPEGVADLGSAHHPNFEVLLGARPDLVVGDRVLHASLAARLEPTGVELMLIDTSSVEGTLAGLAAVAERVGAGEALALDLRNVKSALDSVRLESAPEVLALYGVPGRFLLITSRTWVGDLIVRSGGRLTSPEGLEVARGEGETPRRSHPGYVQINDEWLTAQRPDAVLLLSHGDPEAIESAFRARVAEGGAWQPLADSTKGRIHALSPRLFATNPGLGLPEAALELGRVLDAPPAVAAGPAR